MKFDKNTAIGFTLMILLLLGFSWYQANEQEKTRQEQQAQLDSTAAQQTLAPVAPEPQAAVADTSVSDSLQQVMASQQQIGKYGLLAPSAEGEAASVVLRNSKVKLTLS
ncbi:MAG: hypothetical protein ACKO7B_09960, partial [Flavobacteriales bacterium]